MDRPDDKVMLSVEADDGAVDLEKESSLQRAEAASSEEKIEKKPQVSEEIIIEEISIDGMCGVY